VRNRSPRVFPLSLYSWMHERLQTPATCRKLTLPPLLMTGNLSYHFPIMLLPASIDGRCSGEAGTSSMPSMPSMLSVRHYIVDIQRQACSLLYKVGEDFENMETEFAWGRGCQLPRGVCWGVVVTFFCRRSVGESRGPLACNNPSFLRPDAMPCVRAVSRVELSRTTNFLMQL
jgi:hypothetical protein